MSLIDINPIQMLLLQLLSKKEEHTLSRMQVQVWLENMLGVIVDYPGELEKLQEGGYLRISMNDSGASFYSLEEKGSELLATLKDFTQLKQILLSMGARETPLNTLFQQKVEEKNPTDT